MGYREQLNECTDPVAGDWLEITNTGNATDKEQKLDAGRLAILANANVFVPLTTSVIPVTINMPASTSVYAFLARYNSVDRMYINQSSNRSQIVFSNFDNGSDIGPHVNIGRNSNASTPGAGFIYMMARTGTQYATWVDNTGTVRVGTTLPTSANDTSGSVIGAQTSWEGAKEDIAEWDDNRAALDAILACRLFSYRMKGDESQRNYRGLVIHDEDRGAWFSDNDAENQIPALNTRNLFGYLIGAIQAQQAQIEALRAEVENLKNAN